MTPYYSDGLVDLYLGDCLDLMGSLAPRSFSMVLADLPYGTTRNTWDRELPNKLLWHHYHNLVPERAAVVLFGTGTFGARLIVENMAEYRYSLVWDKVAVTGFLNAKKQPLRAHEDLHVFYGAAPTYHPQMVYTGRRSHSRGKRVDRTLNHYGAFVNTETVEQEGYQYPRSILTFPRPKKAFHPTQKPVELCEWLIRSFTNPNDIVLDNVAGSATTLVAARNCGRRAVGIENHEPFAERAALRLQDSSPGQLVLDA